MRETSDKFSYGFKCNKMFEESGWAQLPLVYGCTDLMRQVIYILKGGYGCVSEPIFRGCTGVGWSVLQSAHFIVRASQNPDKKAR